MYKDITYLIKEFEEKYNEYPNLVIIPEERYYGDDRLRYREYNDNLMFKDIDYMEKPKITRIDLRIIPCKHIDKPMVLKEVK